MKGISLATLAVAAAISFGGTVATVAPAEAHHVRECTWHHHVKRCHWRKHPHVVCKWKRHHGRVCRRVWHR